MEILILAAIAGIVGYIAGKDRTKSNTMTIDKADHLASLSYIAGYEEGIRFAARTVDQFGPSSTKTLLAELDAKNPAH